MTGYLLLQVWDRISLQFALRHAADGVISPLPLRGARSQLRCHARGRFKLALEPYPFDRDELSAPVTAQLIPDRAYSNPEDFLATLSAAEQRGIECVIVRP
jgi:hypothetical protein